ncbi:class I SAM-dependent methyltransferase [Tengunoibacter tsumagoiensis]|uniref:Methyltransferase domain-containing protein n=1 Tax=Tengunoibacter tsumagoiensis TaxID=2014871 RepID=A0A402A092_9CHLR|nr:class I SAM-dependent methyltransferase [Tengunoibacter tsumagoiensis]GCE12472.1 hypothetical protein KTT_23310 [Tengunoibacter tsumagoiensis]
MPKDGQEDERINFQHYVLLKLLGNLYTALLVSDITSVLDVGTGTGKWATAMATKFPAVEVVGLDIEAPTKKVVTPLPNYRFVSGNVLEGLPFPDHTFSYVHQRLLVAATPAVRWPSVMKELGTCDHTDQCSKVSDIST